MKRCIFFLTLFSAVLCLNANAQQRPIVAELESSSIGQGTISIESDPAISSLLGKSGLNPLETKETISTNGFRIQVFMGSNPRSAREEALKKKYLLNEAFPELATYVSFDSPHWKLLAGDFLTRDEAMVFRQKIQKAFPDLGKEIYTVTAKINASLQPSAE